MTMTPMIRQYYNLKNQFPKGFLFFRMGDFYELFGEDALTAAPLLGLTLSAREQGGKTKIPFCGVPHHSAQTYWLKLLKMGHCVALADQMEEASGNGLVRRDITKVMSPGCLEDLESLEDDAPNYLMAAYEIPEKKIWTVALADVSTGEFRAGQTQNLLDTLGSFQPKELLVRKFCKEAISESLKSYQDKRMLSVDILKESYLQDPKESLALLTQTFGPLSFSEELVPVSGALLAHIRDQKIALDRFQKLAPLAEPHTMNLSDTVTRDLELFETSWKRQLKGSLIHQINGTLSPMGARLLRWHLGHPYLSPAPILERQGRVQAFCDLGIENLQKIRDIYRGIGDITRLSARLSGLLSQPGELARIRETLSASQALAQNLTGHPLGALLLAGLKDLDSLRELLPRAILSEPQGLGKGDQVFKRGYDGDLDRLLDFSSHGQEKVEAYEAQLREQTGIQSLKIKAHKSFGLLIDVTKSNLPRVPGSFIRRQTMVGGERFMTEELRELDEALSGAQDQAIQQERDLYTELLQRLKPCFGALESLGQVLAEIDLTQSFAWLALTRGYTKPTLDQNLLHLEGARHPVVEHRVGAHRFAPHDLTLTHAQKQVLITGPNMAGKSTVMREVALCGILCQIGAFVPARKATLPIFDQIFTRVGASDDLSSGLSTFMVEMTESAQILREATPRSLVILDEVGRGTSTEDGLAIAKAILENLAQDIQAWTLFATHYHELVPFCQSLPQVRPMETEVLLGDGGQISFTHRLKDGASGSSYGIEVASIGGIPGPVVARAKLHLQTPLLITQPKGEETRPALPNPRTKKLQAIGEQLEMLNISRMTPLKALNLLEQWKEMLYQEEFPRKQRSLFPDEFPLTQ